MARRGFHANTRHAVQRFVDSQQGSATGREGDHRWRTWPEGSPSIRTLCNPSSLMTPNFAQAVDPIFLYVLALLDRISRDAKPKPQEERVRIRALIDEAEARLGSSGE